MSFISPYEQPENIFRRWSPSPDRDPDAGLRAVTHYERRLPKWRYRLRQWLIPIVRWETPYLAWMQTACRSPLLDSYFAFAANLGTHTFFMTFLPICFWCGSPDWGVALAQMLALGVYLSGVLKDLLCLPRPLSPPLHRITMSGSAALEYGFPSTHTTNAVSVALFCLYKLHLSQESFSIISYRLLFAGCCWYAVSITIGRVYCGMHGYFDVGIGFILGAFITWLRVAYGPAYDLWTISGEWLRPALTVLTLALAVQFHPEPADNCPCFDDSVAFLGVLMGVAVGTWNYAQRQGAQASLTLSLAQIYAFTNHDLLKSVGRLVFGVTVIFVWRAVMKPLLLTCLPPTFRFVDHWGLMIPRRFFLQASDYKQVPPLGDDDNVLPAARRIPSLLSAFRNPRRRRISVGPQSEADAREYIANREQQRRNRSRSSDSPRRKLASKASGPVVGGSSNAPSLLGKESTQDVPNVAGDDIYRIQPMTSLHVSPVDKSLLTPPASDAGASSDSGNEDQSGNRKIFAAIIKPRTHYDVEVITKLVVYSGISWLVVFGNPILFERFGLVDT